jgi:TrmH family RNA methyltransferase
MSAADPREFFERARTDRSLVVLEGLHALKHALRFGARIHAVITPARDQLLDLTRALAPDVLDRVDDLAQLVDHETFDQASQRAPASPVLAVAETRRRPVEAIGDGLVVVLYDPRHAGNAGAVIRVAAAAEAAAVVIVGDLDPWSAPVVRAAAGLHYAVDVCQGTWPLGLDRPLVALDANDPTAPFEAPPRNAALVFGSERFGLADEVLRSVDRTMHIPMRPGVSSLNLATSAAAALYGLRVR